MSIYDDQNEVKTSWVKWGKVGDHIEGTLISIREIASQLPGKEGTMVKVYEIKADSGEFHETDGSRKAVPTATKIEKEAVYAVGGRPGIDAQMRRIKLGQKIGIKFTEEKPSTKKGFNALKIIKVYSEGKMDEEWVAEQEEINPKDIV